MRKTLKLLGFIAVIAIIAFGMTACDGDDEGPEGTLTLTAIADYAGFNYVGFVSLEAAYSGSENVTFKWERDDAALTVTTNTIASPAAGTYKVIISFPDNKDYDDITSNTVTVIPAPAWSNCFNTWRSTGQGIAPSRWEELKITPTSFRLDDNDGDWWEFNITDWEASSSGQPSGTTGYKVTGTVTGMSPGYVASTQFNQNGIAFWVYLSSSGTLDLRRTSPGAGTPGEIVGTGSTRIYEVKQ